MRVDIRDIANAGKVGMVVLDAELTTNTSSVREGGLDDIVASFLSAALPPVAANLEADLSVGVLWLVGASILYVLPPVVANAPREGLPLVVVMGEASMPTLNMEEFNYIRVAVEEFPLATPLKRKLVVV